MKLETTLAGRQFGKTRKMIEDAVAAAREGRYVHIVGDPIALRVLLDEATANEPDVRARINVQRG